MATDPPRREGGVGSSRTQDSPSADSNSSAKRTSSQSLADPGDEESNSHQPPPSHSTCQSSRSSPISVPSDQDDDYDPSHLEDDDDDEEEVNDDAPPRRRRGFSEASGASSATFGNVGSSDFPFLPAMHGTGVEWSKAEDQIVIECVRKHGRQWAAVTKAYAKAAKGLPSRTAAGLSHRYKKLAKAAMEKQGGVQRGESTQGGQRRGGKGGRRGELGGGAGDVRVVGTRRASTSSAVSQGTFSFNRSNTGRRSQQLAPRHQDGSDEGEEDSAGGQDDNSGELEVKQEVNEDVSQPPSRGSTVAGPRSRSTTNASPHIEEIDCDATYEDWGMTFQGVPSGYTVFIFSPRRFKIRGPTTSRRRQQQREEDEEAAFVFNIQDGSVQATTSPPNTAMQVSLAPPSMTFTAPDKFTVVFLL